MSRYFDLDEANATLPELRAILDTLRTQRLELIRLRDEAVRLRAAMAEAPGGGEAETSPQVEGAGTGRRRSREATRAAAELRVLRLRMQGVVDQMQAGVARIDDLGVVLRDIDTGLVDFPALASGRPIWLCWRLGEDDGIAAWHELSTGVAGRRSLGDLS